MASLQFTDSSDTLLKLNREAKEKAEERKIAKEKERLANVIEEKTKLAMALAEVDGKARHLPNRTGQGVRRVHLYDLPEEARMQCVQDYFLCGSLKDVATRYNVIHKEMFDAATQAWWQIEISALQRESVLMMKSKLDRIMNMTLEGLEDRVTKGDIRFDDDGNEQRFPVSAQTLATVANVIFDKKLKLEDRASGFVEGENKRLIDLANSLTMMGAKPVEVIDVDVIDDELTDERNEDER